MTIWAFFRSHLADNDINLKPKRSRHCFTWRTESERRRHDVQNIFKILQPAQRTVSFLHCFVWENCKIYKIATSCSEQGGDRRGRWGGAGKCSGCCLVTVSVQPSHWERQLPLWIFHEINTMSYTHTHSRRPQPQWKLFSIYLLPPHSRVNLWI